MLRYVSKIKSNISTTNMLTVVFRITGLAQPVRVSAGWPRAEDEAPAGLAGGGGRPAAEQGREERAGLPGVRAAGAETGEIPLGPQQGAAGEGRLHGLRELVIYMSDCHGAGAVTISGAASKLSVVITTYKVGLDILSADIGSFGDEDLSSHFQTLVRILEGFGVGS